MEAPPKSNGERDILPYCSSAGQYASRAGDGWCPRHMPSRQGGARQSEQPGRPTESEGAPVTVSRLRAALPLQSRQTGNATLRRGEWPSASITCPGIGSLEPHLVGRALVDGPASLPGPPARARCTLPGQVRPDGLTIPAQVAGDGRHRPPLGPKCLRLHVLLPCQHPLGAPSDRRLPRRQHRGSPIRLVDPQARKVGNFSERIWGVSDERGHRRDIAKLAALQDVEYPYGEGLRVAVARGEVDELLTG